MGTIEQKIKDFAKEQGVAIVGIAGPGRLDGPPSLDPTYTMSGAKSIVSLVVPMDTSAIYKFLGKEAYEPHLTDQTRWNAKFNRVGAHIAGYIKSLGYRAEHVPTNNSYRRSPDAFATHPSFSHRFGTLASGIGAQGWSGNVMTEEFGASIYLSTVVTEAVLESDKPRYKPRHFIDDYCIKCRMCEKTCVAGMFEPKNEEYVLLNGELHPRGKRRDIWLCNASCFGLHSLSRDKKWTTWGTRWIDEWIDKDPDKNNKLKTRAKVLVEGVLAGDSTPRYSIIRQNATHLQPEDVVEGHLEKVANAKSETERFKLLDPYMKKMGVVGTGLMKNERVLTCGQCALVCGPTIEECSNRYSMLQEGGFVVPGPNDEVTIVETYEEAMKMREKYLPKVPLKDTLKDFAISTVMWHKYYGGIEPKSEIGGVLYDRKLKKAVSQKVTGHLNS
jgi:ferredoxin